MSEKIESVAAPTRDNRAESNDDDVRSLPDLEAWMNEIEEFVAEISNDLNDIGKALGDRTLSAGSRGNASTQNSPRPNRSEPATETQSSNANLTQDTDQSEKADRLGSLKRRLANLKQEPSSEALPSIEEANADG